MTGSAEKTRTPGEVIKDNVKAFFDARQKVANPETLRSRYGIGNGGAQSILRGDADPRLSTLAKIARKEGCELWQLLHPGFSPEGLKVSKEQAREVEEIKQKVDTFTPSQVELLKRSLMGDAFDPEKMSKEWDASNKNKGAK